MALSALSAGNALWGMTEELDSTVTAGRVDSTVSSLLKKLTIVQNQVGYVQFLSLIHI